MKRLKALVAGLAILAGTATVPFAKAAGLSPGGDDTVFRYHFAGAAAFAASTNFWRIEKILENTNSVALQKELVRKLAVATPELFGLGKIAPAQAKALEPLWDDAWRRESVVELKRNGQGTPELLVMVKAGADRAEAWKHGLAQAFPGRSEIEVATRGEWVVFGLRRSASGSSSWEKAATDGKASETFGKELGWLEADINWPAVESMVPNAMGPFKAARTRLDLWVKGETVRSEARLVYPTPISSFSGMHNLAALFKESDFFQRIGYNPFAGDLYFWGQPLGDTGPGHLPLPIVPSFAVAKVEEPAATLKSLSTKLPDALNERLASWNWGQIYWSESNHAFGGIVAPGVAPQLRATNDAGSSYLYGSIFMPMPPEDPMPAGLLSQVQGQKDLVYYGWEVTQVRLHQWRALKGLLPLFPVKANPDMYQSDETMQRKVFQQQWLGAFEPLLGECVTELRQASPKEFVLRRKSYCGLTGCELVYLSHWLTEPGFPFVGRGLPTASQPGDAALRPPGPPTPAPAAKPKARRPE